MNKFEMMRAVICISGDYCAFHEASINCEYVFGHGEMGYNEDISDYFINNIKEFSPKHESEEDYDTLLEVYENSPIEVKDSIAEKLYGGRNNYSGYSDYKIMSVLVELNEEGKIVNTYMSV